MPLYDYLCNECGHQFEEYVSQLDEAPPAMECPHCEKKLAKRLPSIIGGYHIKGNNAASTRPKGAGSKKR